MTIVTIFPGSGGPVETPPEVRFDRPFLFAIRDTQTGTLYFLGRVIDQSKTVLALTPNRAHSRRRPRRVSTCIEMKIGHRCFPDAPQRCLENSVP